MKHRAGILKRQVLNETDCELQELKINYVYILFQVLIEKETASLKNWHELHVLVSNCLITGLTDLISFP